MFIAAEFMCSHVLISQSWCQKDISKKYEQIILELHAKFSWKQTNYSLEFGVDLNLGFLPRRFYCQNFETVWRHNQTYLIFVYRFLGCLQGQDISLKCKGSNKKLVVNVFQKCEWVFYLPATSANFALCLEFIGNLVGVRHQHLSVPLLLSSSSVVHCRCRRVCWRRLLQPGLYQRGGGVPVLVRAGLRAPTWQAQLQSSGWRPLFFISTLTYDRRESPGFDLQ